MMTASLRASATLAFFMQIERRTHDYERHDTTTLFAALDVKAGTIVGKCMPRHRASEFRKFFDEIGRNVPCTSSWTTHRATGQNGSAAGSPSDRTGTSTSRRHLLPGSTRSSRFFARSPPISKAETLRPSRSHPA